MEILREPLGPYDFLQNGARLIAFVLAIVFSGIQVRNVILFRLWQAWLILVPCVALVIYYIAVLFILPPPPMPPTLASVYFNACIALLFMGAAAYSAFTLDMQDGLFEARDRLEREKAFTTNEGRRADAEGLRADAEGLRADAEGKRADFLEGKDNRKPRN